MAGGVVTIRQLGADDWRAWRELRLRALGEAAYAFGSKLADWQGIGDTERRWRNRFDVVPFNVIADLNHTPVGMVGAVPEGDNVELLSMWVAPSARGCGVGDALVNAVISWAGAFGAVKVVLSVVEGNSQAVALYRRHGFLDAGRVENANPLEPIERWMVRGLVDQLATTGG